MRFQNLLRMFRICYIWQQVSCLGTSKRIRAWNVALPLITATAKDLCHPQAGMEVCDQQKHYLPIC